MTPQQTSKPQHVTKPTEPASPPVHSWPTAAKPDAPVSLRPPVETSRAAKLVVVGLAAALVIAGISWGVSRGARPGGGVATESIAQRAAGALAVTGATAPDQTRRATPTMASRRPIGPRASARGPYTLTGIAEGLGESMAVINGNIVAVGQRIGDAMVVQIANGSVILQRDNGQEVVLWVPR